MDNDDWNLDYFDDLMSDEDVPDEVKRDVAALKENHAEVKEKLDKKKKEIDEAMEKVKELDDVTDQVEQWVEDTSDYPALVEPVGDNPDVLKKKLKEIEVLWFSCSMLLKTGVSNLMYVIPIIVKVKFLCNLSPKNGRQRRLLYLQGLPLKS